MSNVPRKLLVIQKDPPAQGFVVMLEGHNRTMSLQLDQGTGEEVMHRLQETIIDFAVQRGWVMKSIPIPPSKRQRKRRSV